MPSAFLPSSFALFCLLYVIFFLHLIPFFCFYISLAMYSLISFAQSFRLSFVPFLRIPFLQLQASPPYKSAYSAATHLPPVLAALPCQATGWTVRGSNPGGGEVFCSRRDRPWGPPSLLYNGHRVSFPGVKRPGRGVDHPPPSSARVKERVELYLYSPSGPSWPVLGKPLPLPFTVPRLTLLSMIF